MVVWSKALISLLRGRCGPKNETTECESFHLITHNLHTFYGCLEQGWKCKRKREIKNKKKERTSTQETKRALTRQEYYNNAKIKCCTSFPSFLIIYLFPLNFLVLVREATSTNY